MRHLLLDHGNSRLKWGVRHQGQWESQGHLTGHELSHLDDHWVKLPPIDSVQGVSVGPHAQCQRIESACQQRGWQVQWHTSGLRDSGIINHYDNPSQLGADRWMALIAARQLNPEAATLVIMAGTATTIDSLDHQGNFLGGLIVPGIGLMRQSLAQGTAHLPTINSGTYTPQARNTVDAMHSGTLAATLGAIGWARAALGNATVLLGGGFHAQLSPYLPVPLRVIPDLVLEGLALAYAPDQ